MSRTIRRLPIHYTVLLALAALPAINACQQDPAFIEKARNITEEERAARQKEDLDGTAKRRSGSRDEAVDYGSVKGAADATAAGNGNNVAVVVNTTTNVSIEGGDGSDGKDRGSELPGDGELAGDEGNKGTELPGGGSGTEQPQAKPTPEVVVVTPSPTKSPNGNGGGPTKRPGAEVVVTHQTERGKVDIMWVVDSSGSMEWAQSRLASKFESFAKKLQAANVDFRLGVTTTDVCQINWSNGTPVADEYCPDTTYIQSGTKVNGKMIGPMRGEFITDSVTGNKVLSSSDSFVDAFKRIARAGTDGSAFEYGLTAAQWAIQKAQSGVNAGFLRNDAFLSVIVLSDEEDNAVENWCEDAWGRTSTTANGTKDLKACKSNGNSPFLDAFGMPPFALTKNSSGQFMTQYRFGADDFVSYLNQPGVKGEGKFRVSAITGVRNGRGQIECSLDNGPEESGTNYIKAAMLTGGVVENICADDWSAGLANIGQNTAELSSKIKLPNGKVPYPDTLEVYVNGTKLGSEKYYVEVQGNYLVLKEVPGAGAHIKVVYKETVSD